MYFNTTLAETGVLDTGAKIQYLCMLVRGVELRQFDLLSIDVESAENLNVEYIIKCLELNFYPLNSISKQNGMMRRGMKNHTV